jgi:hypothetical protein
MVKPADISQGLSTAPERGTVGRSGGKPAAAARLAARRSTQLHETWIQRSSTAQRGPSCQPVPSPPTIFYNTTALSATGNGSIIRISNNVIYDNSTNFTIGTGATIATTGNNRVSSVADGGARQSFSDSSGPESPKPLAAMARCTLFWKLESSPRAMSSALSAMMPVSASTQGRSLLAKSLST